MKRIIAVLEKPIGVVGGVVRLLIALVIFAVALTFCLRAVDSRDGDTVALDARTSLQDAAGSVLTDVFSVDSRSWSRDREVARSLVAPPLSVASGRALTGPPPDGATSVNWVPQNIAVSWADETGGEALIVVRVTVTARSGHAESRVKSVLASYTRSGDRWLLRGLEELQ